MPSAVLVWDPSEVAQWELLDSEDGWWMAGCLSTTRAGDRAAVYQTRQDQGVVGFFDFSTPAFAHPDFGYAAFGRPAPLRRPMARGALLGGELAPVFRRIQRRRRLPVPAATELTTTLGRRVPAWQQINEPLPDDAEDWVWIPSRDDASWGIEAAMRDAIRDTPAAYKRLGFAAAPSIEVRPPGSLTRMDLHGPGVVVECKLVAGLATLDQLDGYLNILRAEEPGGWKGHIVADQVVTSELRRAIFARPDVRLWVCRRDDQDTPLLIELTRRRPLPPDMD
jgi:hypothetical protein